MRYGSSSLFSPVSGYAFSALGLLSGYGVHSPIGRRSQCALHKNSFEYRVINTAVGSKILAVFLSTLVSITGVLQVLY